MFLPRKRWKDDNLAFFVHQKKEMSVIGYNKKSGEVV
jgi:hypothetical protein